MRDAAGLDLDWYGARAAHIAAAAQTDSGRVKRPQGKIIGRLEFFREKVPSTGLYYIKHKGEVLGVVDASAFIEAAWYAGATHPTRLTWAIVPETRAMRRQQERREEAQRF